MRVDREMDDMQQPFPTKIFDLPSCFAFSCNILISADILTVVLFVHVHVQLPIAAINEASWPPTPEQQSEGSWRDIRLISIQTVRQSAAKQSSIFGSSVTNSASRCFSLPFAFREHCSQILVICEVLWGSTGKRAGGLWRICTWQF